jgi:hypothetical protein
MNSGRRLTGMLDLGLMAPIPGKVTGPSFWAAVSCAERRVAGWVIRLSWAACGNGWPAVTPGFKAKPDAHRMYAQDQVVIHTVRM